MTLYLIAGGIVAVALIVAAMHYRPRYHMEVQPSFEDLLAHLRAGEPVRIANRDYAVTSFDRLGITSVTPRFRFWLSDDIWHRWLDIQTYPSSEPDAWLLTRQRLYRGPLPARGQTEMVLNGRRYTEGFWGNWLCYPNDGAEPDVTLHYCMFYEARQPGQVGDLASVRDLLLFEWGGDGREVEVYTGKVVSLSSIQLL